ncbi:MAG: nitrite reductase small subunit NirD [Actinobacteria bacterium]|nr:nitrite reductase small subunit NirD [Actinomycetota bacterium]
MTVIETTTWIDVCAIDQLVPDRGACVRAGLYQIALFRLSTTDELYALSNYDPKSGAFVMSRGIVGSRADIPKVASPMYKQSFDLRTGECLDDPATSVMTFPVRVVEDRVLVGIR